ncbi:MAG: metal-dependent transcriptional regulator [Desulfurococcales archaeon]|nr:metal-dependent transcriptional regulator [Desulfurococcales archaeon]
MGEKPERLNLLKEAHRIKRSLSSMAEEDYIEAIYELEKELGYVKLSDIAEVLGVRLSSVTEMIKKLEKKGFVEYKRYRYVKLTDKGREIGEKISRKHSFLLNFFLALGVERGRANIEAELLEHFLSDETIEKLRELYEKCMKIDDEN